ncbi:MAG: hypothetical protein K0R03_1184 [Moraxellaceae bacterium]|jgi:hypothetical protein|nr:hypothetical protein [Moraxellaceae bacterium]
MHRISKGLGVLAMLLGGNAMADLHLAATAGLSAGGDTLAEVYYTDGSSEKIKGGGLIYLGIGPSFEFKETPWSAQILIGRHFDDISAENATVEFTRNTLEAQVFYRSGDHRFGFGLVKHSSVEYESSGAVVTSTVAEFDDARGASLEYNWLPVGSKFGVSLRAVQIDYELATINGTPVPPESFSGDHFAAGVYLYF